MKRIFCLLLSACLLLTLASCGFRQGSEEPNETDMEELFRNMVATGTVEQYAKGCSVDTDAYKYLETDLDQNGLTDYLLCASVTKPEDPDGEYMLFLPFLAGEHQFSTAFSKIIDCRSEVFRLVTDDSFAYLLTFFREEGESYVVSAFSADDKVTRLWESFACAEDGGGELAWYYSDSVDMFDDDTGLPYGDNLLSDAETVQDLYDVYIAYSYEAACENGILDGFEDLYIGEDGDDVFEEYDDEELIEIPEDTPEDTPEEEPEEIPGEIPTELPTAKPTTTQAPTKPASDELTPTKAELEKLARMAYSWTAFNSAVGTATGEIYLQALGLGGYYGSYYDTAVYEDCDLVDGTDPDPRAEYNVDGDSGYSYYVYPGKAVDRFLREVMNVQPDHSVVAYDDFGRVYCYYENGSYYVRWEVGGFEIESAYVSHTTLPDGKVAVKVNVNEIGSDHVLQTKTVTAKLKLIDGERIWSIYKVV